MLPDPPPLALIGTQHGRELEGREIPLRSQKGVQVRRRTGVPEASEPHRDVVRAVRLAQAAAECLERGDHRFKDIGLTDEQRDRIDGEFSLADAAPRDKEPLLAI